MGDTLSILMLIATLIYSYLILDCKRSAFVFGVIASGMMAFSLIESGVLVQALLHFIYVLIYSYSFIMWGKKKNPPSISNMSKKMLIITFVYIITFTIVMGYSFNDLGTRFAYIDAFSSACSMTAVFLLSRKIIEHAYIFIASNIASIYICYMVNDRVAIITFFVYMLFNLMRIYTWGQMKNERIKEV